LNLDGLFRGSRFQDSEEYSDVLTNLQAAQKHLDFINTGFRHVLDALPTSLATTIESNPPPVQSAHPITALSKAPPTVPIVQAEKKVRKSRVPKGVIPGVTPPPDPERWLKKSERSTFGQGKRRRGPGGGGGATQGSAAFDSPSSAPSKSSGSKGKKRK
jgi:signal recognition particle subunit SRP72